jgi:predicted lysophospholipase L1 biosynthesis ABC-type transport system permease subunit
MDSQTVQVVGMLADVRDHSIEQPVEPRFYLAYAQTRDTIPGSIRLEVRTTGNPAAVIAAVRRELRALDVNLGGSAIDALTTLLRQGIAEARLLTKLASGFGLLALMLAAVGLYGVLTYAVSRRTGEIGLRVALGAQPRDVVGLVLRDAMRLVIVGVVIGVPLSYGAARLLRSQLFGVESFDPVSVGVSLVVLAASAMLAALVPALRAARVAPLVALRQE